VPENAHVLPPAPVISADALVAVVGSEGKMLTFPVRDIPEMPRGKGNKLYDISGKKAASREEFLTGMAVVPPNGTLILWAGEERKELSWKDLADYRGQRAQRGAVLPRGWRKITRLESTAPAVAVP